MNRFLNDVISIAGSARAEKAAILLHGAKVDKVTLTRLANRLNETSMFSNVVLGLVKNQSLASGVFLSNLMSEVYSRLNDMFAASNAISVLVDSNSEILSEEIKKLEDELLSLEKSVNNYGFLLADGNSYDSAFIETFSDTLNSEDLVATAEVSRFSDRSGVDFSLDEAAFVDKQEGVLVIPNALNKEYPIKASIWASNCASFLTNPSSSNLISNTVDYKNLNGWRAIVDSPIIVDSNIYLFSSLYGGKFSYSGAQFIIEYLMNEENPVDTLVVEPFDDYGFDLVQVVGFKGDNDQVGEELMSSPVRVENVYNVIFPKKSFKKFHLFINQTTYTRNASNKNFSEAAAETRQKVIDKIQSNLYDGKMDIDSEYPVVDLSSYWKNVLGNLQDSLGSFDSEILQQGIPSYWSYENGLSQKKIGILEAQDGSYYGRDDYVSGVDVNHSYMQSLMNRFFGQAEMNIGRYFKPLISKYFYPNAPQSSNPVDSNESEQRVSPFPRIGEEEAPEVELKEETDNYLIGSINTQDIKWTPRAKWDFWLNGVVQQILEREDSQIIPPNLMWSETTGKWIENPTNEESKIEDLQKQQDNYPDLENFPRIIRDANSRVDEPFKPSPGGGAQYTIPSISYDDILLLDESSYKYRYVLGIKSVRVKLCNYLSRAFYISKPIGASGDISEVKLKEFSTNYFLDNESNSLTSVEYSVSNKADISSESSWTPILPIGTSVVRNERIFPDSNGVALFRFNAIGESISLFKNGFLYKESDFSSFYLTRENNNNVYGLKIPLSKYTSADILTCSYGVDGKASIVSFDNYSNTVSNYIAYSENDLPGQSFYGNGKVEYALDYIPYIDYGQVATSDYSDFFGLTPYAPISILFSDGSYATNLTNYKNKSIVTLNKNSDNYQFLQSGNVLIFNKPVNMDFRVFYNFLPSNFRVRVILRSNYLSGVSPKVDFYQVKSRTRKPDSQRY